MSDVDAAAVVVLVLVLLELKISCVPIVIPVSPVFGSVGRLANSVLILAIVKGPKTPTPGKPTLV